MSPHDAVDVPARQELLTLDLHPDVPVLLFRSAEASVHVIQRHDVVTVVVKTVEVESEPIVHNAVPP